MTIPGLTDTPTQNRRLIDWVTQVAELTQPDRVEWSDGSQEEWDRLSALMVEHGTFIRLNDDLRPNSFLARSDPSDVARVEDRTFICSQREEDAGPTNNWHEPDEMRATLSRPLPGRDARPDDVRRPVLAWVRSARRSPSSGWRSPTRRTSSLNMRIMTRMGTAALAEIGEDGDFVPALHSVGAPLEPGQRTSRGRAATPSTSSTSRRRARSGPTAPATAATHCSARSASPCASPRRWRATRAGWPSTCSSSSSRPRPGTPTTSPRPSRQRLRQDQPRHAAADDPGLEGRDRRRRHRVDAVRRRRPALRHQPGGRLLRRRAGHRRRRPTRTPCDSLWGNCIFTNVALTDDGDVWWEGLTDEPPAHLIDWKGNDWTPASQTPAAHPNARFTAPAAQCPSIADGVGGPGTGCRSPRSCSAAAAPRSCRW